MIFISGSSGYIGQNLISDLAKEKCDGIILGNRKRLSKEDLSKHKVLQFDFADNFNIINYLKGVDTIVHLAAAVHFNSNTKTERIFHEVNTLGSRKLAMQAAEAGVNKFIFLSSIGVNGSESKFPFKVNDKPNPSTPYAISKYQTEIELYRLSKNSAMKVVVIRAPIVYGPLAPGNFSKLINVIKSGVPLPFASLNNIRSYVYIKNLTDLIIYCIKSDITDNKTILVCDEDDIAFNDLIKKLKNLLNTHTVNFRFPVFCLQILFKAIGKYDYFRKLSSSLQIDHSEITKLIDWRPKFDLDSGLENTTQKTGIHSHRI